MKKIIGASWAEMFELRGQLPLRTRAIIFSLGVVMILATWWIMAAMEITNTHVLPHPLAVFGALIELLSSLEFIKNFLISLELNIMGYIVAIAISLPLGFLVGLFPFFDALVGWWLKTFRFWPITASVVIFMAMFGTSVLMKIIFLASTIALFLIPAVAQRIRDVDDVLVQKTKTIGGNKQQIIKTVFIPKGLGWAWDDITNLTAISWTYIVFVEMINSGDGGVGAFVNIAYFRLHRSELLWAVVIILLCWGIVQDKLFSFGSRVMFGWKQQVGRKK